MNTQLTNLVVVLLFTAVSVTSWAQDSELGGLPPIPDLDVDTSGSKKNLFKKVKSNRKAADARYEENVYTRPRDQKPNATFSERVMGVVRNSPQKMPVSKEITVQNSMPSPDDSVTASGSRLKPFGEEDQYWPEELMVEAEDPLAMLPPLPDLRTPDQVSSKERLRNLRVAKFEKRKAEQEAKRAEKELAARTTVDQPMADPSSALVIVESQRSSAMGYVGNSELPETPNKGTLKPFNANSTYVKDNAVVYQGDQPIKPVQAWWARGQRAGSPAPDERKWRWGNPFSVNNDVPETASFRRDAAGPGSAGSQTYAAGNPELDASPLTSNLRGILVVTSTRDVVKSGLGSVNGVESRGVDLPDRVRSVFQSRIGRNLTLGGLNTMVRDAVIAYRKSDLPVVDVLVPEQEITTGVLQLVIIEGRLGDVIVEGVSPRESQSLANQIHVERGEVIRESQLLEDVSWINKNPARRVDLIFSPGTNYGETDIILRSEAYRAISAYMAYENSGTDATGENRGIFGASWVGPLFFDMNSILSYQFTTSFDSPGDLFGHSGVFASYLPWQHQITLLGAYVGSNVNFGGVGAAINTNGINKQGSGRYAIPLDSFGRFSHELEIGMDFKSSNSDLSFGNVAIFNTISEIVQYSLGYNILAKDDTGTWRVDIEVVNSPGGNTNKNTNAIFASQRAFATADYTYGRVVIERDQELANGWSAFGKLAAQVSNANLLSSETLGAGGFDTVRGFEQRVVSGDSGIVGTAELRTPAFFPSNLAGYSNLQDGARGLIFYDFGTLRSEIPLPGQVDRELGSVGAGLRYQLENWFTLRVDYGFQVTEDGFDDGQEGRWHVGARATF